MATFSRVVVAIIIFILYLLLGSACIKAATELPCTYPKGSVACKIYNDTKIDCSWRDLVCIPPLHHKSVLELLDLSHDKLTKLNENSFSGLNRLLTLDLSFNDISAITNGAFSGIINLRVLDLSANAISTLRTSVFHKLGNLHTLDLSSNFISGIDLHENLFSELNLLQTLDMSRNSITSLPDNVWNGLHNLKHLNLRRASNYRFYISKGTFNELSKLNSLDLSFNNLYIVTDSPFRNLTSLRSLNLPETHITPAIFDGLNNSLQFLYIIAFGTETNTPFVYLSSLQHLELDLRTCNYNEKLFTGLEELSYLKLDDWGIYKCLGDIDFGPLVSLTYLEWYHVTSPERNGPIQTLNSLNSPLQTLSLNLFLFKKLTVNSSTFELLPNWRESLQELHVNFHFHITINGSPFTWFPELSVLRLSCQTNLSTIWTSPKDTFKNLKKLKEAHLNYLNMNDSVIYDVLGTFGMYNSLKVLDLSNNILEYPNLNPICNLSALEELYLLSNKFTFLAFPCRMPNLTQLQVRNLETAASLLNFQSLNFAELCNHGYNLKLLNVNTYSWKVTAGAECLNLDTLYANDSYAYINYKYKIQSPHLEDLYLSSIMVNYDFLKSIKTILTIFNAAQLKTVDLSSNQISVIDGEDARLLSTVTYLNLRNNLLTSLSKLNHLYEIEELLLSNNKISIAQTLTLSKTSLQTVDLRDNVFLCDCNVEDLQIWMANDRAVYLWNSPSTANRYRCVEPDSVQGLSIREVNLDCDLPIVTYISIVVTCAVLVIITIITTVMMVKYRWHIQYRLFLLFNRREYQNYLVNNDVELHDFEGEDGVPLYDAYVIYHNQDEDWVDEQLLANIEEGDQEHFKLCLKNRDIRAGRLIFNELSLHIRRSRKTLVILTPRFVDDNWCYFQLNMAHHRVLEENHNVLIFIILEDIPNERLTLLLRQLFCKAPCFKWPNDAYGQDLFWRRLREELKRPVPRDLIHQYRRYNI